MYSPYRGDEEDGGGYQLEDSERVSDCDASRVNSYGARLLCGQFYGTIFDPATGRGGGGAVG